MLRNSYIIDPWTPCDRPDIPLTTRTFRFQHPPSRMKLAFSLGMVFLACAHIPASCRPTARAAACNESACENPNHHCMLSPSRRSQ
ncbi:hypothetical protein MJO28_009266 [Puccinia striiformis f. sp. tritici]|uniref:Uncharacterized protein n=1 Tax=Puccinia striiformis f. sp. tritici TaxID=168172 RepID=A0ACC0E7A1_9BASI|nr:hypothetical protein MJO28_009266 [Puccinia striiformis f. sp. tritici]